MSSSEKRNYWPHGIVLSIFIIFLACVYTVYFAVTNPVYMDSTNFETYQYYDENVNEILAQKKEFNSKYNVKIETDGFNMGKNSLNLKITDKTDNKIDSATIELVLTRPHRSDQDIKLQTSKVEEGIYSFNAFNIVHEGRWQIQTRVKIENISAVFKKEVNATVIQ